MSGGGSFGLSPVRMRQAELRTSSCWHFIKRHWIYLFRAPLQHPRRHLLFINRVCSAPHSRSSLHLQTPIDTFPTICASISHPFHHVFPAGSIWSCWTRVNGTATVTEPTHTGSRSGRLSAEAEEEASRRQEEEKQAREPPRPRRRRTAAKPARCPFAV
jgi:hypothetical protein